jgi:beta-xylosidase
VYSTAAFPDPFVLDSGDTHSDYWAFATGNLFPVLHSADLVHWTSEGTAMSTRPAWVVTSGDWHPWAPSVIHSELPCPGAASGGCYVMYYVGLSAAYNRNCIGVATSPTPGGPYSDRGPLGLAGQSNASMPVGCGDANGVGNIDPSPFLDASGQVYLYLSTDNACTNGASCQLKPTISVIPLSADLLQGSGPRTALFAGDPGTWEAAGAPGPTVEGPSMELHDGTYYLFYSGGSYMQAYGMGYATSSSPTGPFTKSSSNPFFASTADAFSVGGGDRLVVGPHGGLWMVYAARTTSSSPRTLWIDPFTWQTPSPPGGLGVPAVAGPSTTPQSTQP